MRIRQLSLDFDAPPEPIADIADAVFLDETLDTGVFASVPNVAAEPNRTRHA